MKHQNSNQSQETKQMETYYQIFRRENSRLAYIVIAANLLFVLEIDSKHLSKEPVKGVRTS